VLLTAISAQSVAAADDVPQDQQQVQALIARLGDPSFGVRQQAADELKRNGMSALAVLRAHVDDANLEIRYRVRRLIEEIGQQDYEARIAAFLQDPAGASDDSLPGLRAYRESVGTDAAAYRLFAEMLRAEPALFVAWEQAAPEFTDQYTSQFARLQQATLIHEFPTDTQARVCALMFIGSDPSVSLREPIVAGVSSLARDRHFRDRLTDGDQAAAYRRILGRWVARPGAVAAAQKMTLAMQYGLSEGLIPALETVARGERNATRLYAILTISKLGGSEHLPLLERLLADDEVLVATHKGGTVSYSIKTQDVALAALLHMTKQNPREYRFQRLRRNDVSVFSLSTAGFYNDADRELALQKWSAWAQSHPDRAIQPAGDSAPVRAPSARQGSLE
jgi:HEAT repeat protein